MGDQIVRDDAIIVKDLKKSFNKMEVLKGINFSVQRGTVLALLGPNGAGKTTTVRILSTLLSADSGQAVINGFEVSKQSHDVKKSIGLTGQYAAVDEYLNGEENLVMMGRLYKLSKKNALVRAKELLQQFDLEEAAYRAVKTYSGGMRRRLDLAMSLIAAPPIIFLDEPTTGLDPRSRLSLWNIIKKLVEQGTTILLTTQYMEEADHLANKIVVIDHGTVIAEGTARELKQRVGSERLEIVISEKSDFVKAQKAVGKILSADPQTRTINIPIKKGVTELKQTLHHLETAKIEIESLSLHKPTLDDVFLNLTGHVTVQPKEEEKK